MSGVKVIILTLVATWFLWAAAIPLSVTSAILWNGSAFVNPPSLWAFASLTIQVVIVSIIARVAGIGRSKLSDDDSTGCLLIVAIIVSLLTNAWSLSFETLLSIDRPMGMVALLLAGAVCWALNGGCDESCEYAASDEMPISTYLWILTLVPVTVDSYWTLPPLAFLVLGLVRVVLATLGLRVIGLIVLREGHDIGWVSIDTRLTGRALITVAVVALSLFGITRWSLHDRLKDLQVQTIVGKAEVSGDVEELSKLLANADALLETTDSRRERVKQLLLNAHCDRIEEKFSEWSHEQLKLHSNANDRIISFRKLESGPLQTLDSVCAKFGREPFDSSIGLWRDRYFAFINTIDMRTELRLVIASHSFSKMTRHLASDDVAKARVALGAAWLKWFALRSEYPDKSVEAAKDLHSQAVPYWTPEQAEAGRKFELKAWRTYILAAMPTETDKAGATAAHALIAKAERAFPGFWKSERDFLLTFRKDSVRQALAGDDAPGTFERFARAYEEWPDEVDDIAREMKARLFQLIDRQPGNIVIDTLLKRIDGEWPGYWDEVAFGLTSAGDLLELVKLVENSGLPSAWRDQVTTWAKYDRFSRFRLSDVVEADRRRNRAIWAHLIEGERAAGRFAAAYVLSVKGKADDTTQGLLRRRAARAWYDRVAPTLEIVGGTNMPPIASTSAEAMWEAFHRSRGDRSIHLARQDTKGFLYAFKGRFNYVSGTFKEHYR
ncbi:hypothetical protein [Singulisphaera acidiphila]|uniref:Uncharacterized protein n=1 Tax=Singulisphaera acidiphila (strain ATCC BAA-1392 / DSM 18658 / VKM B-2454 / MOB10) TaxID=886293 RepID=L0DRR7_SINAD|nr:hypothetical protein [Singulisphaera acidiphila]AGA31677.1 hypothetical protein Sinac_7647 [Singulisphaera acidiphila DSM 18658]